MIPQKLAEFTGRIEIKVHANLFITITEVNLSPQELRDFAEYLIRVIFKLNKEPTNKASEKDGHRILTVQHTESGLNSENHEYFLLCKQVPSLPNVDSLRVTVEVAYSWMRASVPNKFKKDGHPHITPEQRNHRPILRGLISPTLETLGREHPLPLDLRLPSFQPIGLPQNTVTPVLASTLRVRDYFENLESAWQCLVLSRQTLAVGTCNNKMFAQSADELRGNLVFEDPLMFISIQLAHPLLFILHLKLKNYREAYGLPWEDRVLDLVHVCHINNKAPREGVYIRAKLTDEENKVDDELYDLRWTDDNTDNGAVRELISLRTWDPDDVYANFVQVLMEVINIHPFPNWCNNETLNAVKNLVQYGLQQNIWPMLWWSRKSNPNADQHNLLDELKEEEGDTFVPDQDIKNTLSAKTPNNESSEVNDNAWTVYLMESKLVNAIQLELKRAQNKTAASDSSLRCG